MQFLQTSVSELINHSDMEQTREVSKSIVNKSSKVEYIKFSLFPSYQNVLSYIFSCDPLIYILVFFSIK